MDAARGDALASLWVGFLVVGTRIRESVAWRGHEGAPTAGASRSVCCLWWADSRAALRRAFSRVFFRIYARIIYMSLHGCLARS